MEEMNLFGKTEVTYSELKKTLLHELELELHKTFTKEYSARFLDALLKCTSDIEEIREIFTEKKEIFGTDKIIRTVILNADRLEEISKIIYNFESKIHLVTRPVTHYELFKFYSSDTHKVIETNYNIKLLKEVLKLIDTRFEDLIHRIPEKVIELGDFSRCGIKQNKYAKLIKEIDFSMIDTKLDKLTMNDIEHLRYDTDGNGNIELNRNLTTELELKEVKQAYLAYKPALQEGYCFYRWLTGSVVKDDLKKS